MQMISGNILESARLLNEKINSCDLSIRLPGGGRGGWRLLELRGHVRATALDLTLLPKI